MPLGLHATNTAAKAAENFVVGAAFTCGLSRISMAGGVTGGFHPHFDGLHPHFDGLLQHHGDQRVHGRRPEPPPSPTRSQELPGVW